MQVFDVKEVAEYLKCSISSIRKLVRESSIPFFRIGTKLNFNKETIDLWVKKQEEKNLEPTYTTNIRAIK